LRPGEGFSPKWDQSLDPQVAEEKKRELTIDCLKPFLQEPVPFMREEPPWPKHLSKAPPLTPVTLAAPKFWRRHIQTTVE
jgi:hypothetical protein